MTTLRSRLFTSYLLIIMVGVTTLFVAGSLIASAFFQADIHSILAEKGNTEEGISALNSAFSRGVQSALVIAALASLLSALIISIIISSRLSQPLRELALAAGRIASGNYTERVRAPTITEIAELAYSFNQMAEQLENDERMRRELIADLAHELRTPLTAIEGNMEGLIDGVLEPTPATFGVVQREARRLHRLSEELGELSRVESPALKLNLERMEAREVLEEVEVRVRSQFEFKEIKLQVEAIPGICVKADRDRLEQILINLLSNALRYTDGGGKVWLRALNMEEQVEFQVVDTGIGIKPENLGHVFERFFREDKSRSRSGGSGGSGIGLTIVQSLVEAQGGDIWIESEPGKGTTVHFNLPRVGS